MKNTVRPIAIVVCNALDDLTRSERQISTDSPAASRKVFQMCKALAQSGVRPYVLSLGRGRADSSKFTFAGKACRVHGVSTVYAAFTHRKIWSELLSMIGLLGVLYRLNRNGDRAIIFYNRLPHYLFLLYTAALLGYRCLLDLEDGEMLKTNLIKKLFTRFVIYNFDHFCKDGALLACSALQKFTRIKPIYCYYGIVFERTFINAWPSSSVIFLMSGTLTEETGSHILIDAVRRIRISRPNWAEFVSFEVTGKGESLSEFEQLARESGFPKVRVHGRLNEVEYHKILGRCNVGLALKLVGGELADTTFPSKIMEFAGAGLLVLTTDISDVRKVLGDGARYVSRNDPELLIDHIADIAMDHSRAKQCAIQGYKAVRERNSPQRAGSGLKKFLFRI